MMKMFFHSGLGDLFLFHDLILDKPWKLTLTCGVLFFIAILYESIKYYRSVHCRCYMKKQQQYQVSNGNTSLAHETHAAADGLFMNRCEVAMARENNRIRALSSFLHLIQTTLAYGLMLAAMTFNEPSWDIMCFTDHTTRLSQSKIVTDCFYE
ncbi:hypothetical protein GZH46_01660 [Fragariocoptes setiger]|uniref:Copper transport protein n=1 Tax=Fragariocoptes setiger TaxID=1670756 RepID=A0ABQ7S8R1_9ACAR|nr:hypothetical protein GZH46_01660 [Fragariocoptes setiger]